MTGTPYSRARVLSDNPVLPTQIGNPTTKRLQPILNVFPVILIPSKLWELQLPMLLPPWGKNSSHSKRIHFSAVLGGTHLQELSHNVASSSFVIRGMCFDFSSDKSCNDWNTDSIVPWKSRNRASLLSKMSNSWRFLQCLMRWSPQSSRWMDAGGYLVRLCFLRLWRVRAIWLDSGHLQFPVYS